MNRSFRHLPLAAILLLGACKSAVLGPRSAAQLRAELDLQAAEVDEMEALSALQPASAPPFRLGIAPPLTRTRVGHLAWGGLVQGPVAGPPAWTSEERAVLRRFAEEARAAGLVSELVFLPELLVSESARATPEGFVADVRRAAARQRLDAVLVVQSIEQVWSEASLAALLDLTLVGALVVPAHEVEALGVLEALVLDTRTGYVHLAVSAEVQRERDVAGFHVVGQGRKLLAANRMRGLRRLGRRLLAASRAAG